MHLYARFVVGVAAVALLTSGCSPSAARRDGAVGSGVSDPRSRAANVDHLVPARDSIGPVPVKFVWSSIEGADSYSLGIWNEVDMLLWRMNNITGTEYVRPTELRLEPGTYLWSVSAVRDGQEIAQSGLAAFVVRTTE